MRDLLPEETDEIRILEADILESWDETASLDYIRDFNRQVPPDEFFETLIEDVRKAALKLQSKVNSSENAKIKDWTKLLIRLKAESYVNNFDQINDLEKKLNDASERTIMSKLGNYIKTDVLNSEKMTPRFLRIAESSCEVDLNVIRNYDGNPFGSGSEREEHITKFYEDLYKIPDAAPVNFDNFVEEFLGDLCNHPVILSSKLDPEERRTLDRDITTDELDEAMRTCNMKSAPGIDGIGNKFIKKFWRFFRIPLTEYIAACKRNGRLTGTFKTALIKLIPKKGDTGQIKNWRPISLLSCFYKLISKAVNRRLDHVINKVTSMNQKAYNKERYIQEALISTIDAVRHCELNGISGAILSIDQKKAFDSVYHGYMLQVYRFFGFGEDFIKFLLTIGTGRNARIILDSGKYSREIDLDRGFAQGDGPSPRLYNIGEQILIFRLEYDPRIIGVYVSFLVPRQLVEGGEVYPLQEQAEAAGLKVDPELRHTNRKVPAFADDANGAFKRDAENLARTHPSGGQRPRF